MKARHIEKIAKSLIWIGGIISVSLVLFIVFYVVVRGARALNWDFFFGQPAVGTQIQGSISASLMSTLMLIAITMVILIPLGLGAAIYLAEYAPENWLTASIRRSMELLAGVPSIIFGLFGFALLVLTLGLGYSVLAGALTLVCLLLPFMVRSAEESMKAVPQSLREGALALGATKWQTVRHVVIPGAMPGIVTGIIFCIGGIFAESAPLILTMGMTSATPTSPLDPGRPLAVEIYYRALYSVASPEEKAMIVSGIALVIVAIIVILNLLARWIAGRLTARMEGTR